jgi:hypothetical protein
MARTTRKETDRTLLQALACGATVENAARKAGVGERTVYRRLADTAFRERLNQERLDLVKRTAGMLTGAGPTSVKTLLDLQTDFTVAAAVRRRAARDILEMGLRLREGAELEERLAAIEARLGRQLGDVGSRPTDGSLETGAQDPGLERGHP